MSANQLTPEHISDWTRIVADNPELSSPFFAPEYTLAIGSVLPQVQVAVLADSAQALAFLPFERDAKGIGHRLHFCDYQGLIARRGLELDAKEFIKGCGLRAWDFDHLLASQSLWSDFHRGEATSPVMDLKSGYEAYTIERRSSGSEQIKKSGNLSRRIEREVGALRFEMHVEDPEVLERLLGWRAGKYQDSRHDPKTVSAALRKLLSVQAPGCKGTLSVLYAGDEVAAAHFGLRSAATWHYWFPAYDPKFEKYSPGIILLLRIAELAPRLGITTIDLGMGDQDYKRRLANGSVGIVNGSVEVSPILSLARNFKKCAKLCLSRVPLLHRIARTARGQKRPLQMVVPTTHR